MLEKGRKKRFCFIICIVVICLSIILGVLFLTPRIPDSPERKSFETAKLYLEYSNNVSLVSNNSFIYKDADKSGANEIDVKIAINSISTPTSGEIDLALDSGENEETTLITEFVFDDEGRIFLRFKNTDHFLKSLGYVTTLENFLNEDVIDGIKQSKEDWILINNEDISFIFEELIYGSQDSEDEITCFDNFLSKYDQTTTRFITSTIDDEIEKYVFYTSDDKIEKMMDDLQSCFASSQTKHFINEIVKIVEGFSGLTANLNDESQLITLSVDNELDEYFFKSETNFSYSTKYYYPELPETYLDFDDIFKVDN